MGSLQQKYDSVSCVMAEALRFKRLDLYDLLKEWRSYISIPSGSVQDPSVAPYNGLRAELHSKLVNGSK